jgi:hypothetical protein
MKTMALLKRLKNECDTQPKYNVDLHQNLAKAFRDSLINRKEYLNTEFQEEKEGNLQLPPPEMLCPLL